MGFPCPSALFEGQKTHTGLSSTLLQFLLFLLSGNLAEVLVLLVGLAFKDEQGRSVYPLSPVAALFINTISAGPRAYYSLLLILSALDTSHLTDLGPPTLSLPANSRSRPRPRADCKGRHDQRPGRFQDDLHLLVVRRPRGLRSRHGWPHARHLSHTRLRHSSQRRTG
jgi:hypothetical protein